MKWVQSGPLRSFLSSTSLWPGHCKTVASIHKLCTTTTRSLSSVEANQWRCGMVITPYLTRELACMHATKVRYYYVCLLSFV